MAAQLQPGGSSKTVEIYAMRLQMTAEAFAAKLDDGVWLQKNLFAHLPVTAMQEILATVVPVSILFIQRYLSGGNSQRLCPYPEIESSY